ncbi:unnamed protein product [Hyaloperonospora brassicae]|uniref:Protein phosphatase n=1 Tax=Hyaloperonospora brassicae TaxID=162125 RepID=A0AAV0U668_HYABA|nr:unnamed protein product [Hyaloperonospora brassicae]
MPRAVRRQPAASTPTLLPPMHMAVSDHESSPRSLSRDDEELCGPNTDSSSQSVWLTSPLGHAAMPARPSRFSMPKRRASSLSDLFPRTRSAAASPAKALVSAFHTVSHKTHQKLATFRSHSNGFIKKTVAEVDPKTKTKTTRGGGWRLKVNNSIRRATPVTGTHRFKWGDQHELQHAQRTFEYHGEDAGAVSSYFHIVADGVSSPFGRHSLVAYDGVLVSSAVLSTEVVKCVRVVLEEMTNHNREQLDEAAFEGAIVDAIRTARINCFHHRKSRVATTLAVSYFNRWTGKLLTFSLGDSKCLVVRRGAVVYETLAVLREFNVPTVVNLREQVVPKDYVVQSFALQEGDVCLTFSDGLGDNLYKDDITATLAAPELWDSEVSGLQSVCDRLVDMSKMDEENLSRTDRRSDTDRVLYPFATAAVTEYRKRTLEESKLAGDGLLDSSGIDHMALSLELMKKHDGKQTLDRHLLLRGPSRKHHYSLLQLRLMSQMQTKKPDDITLFMTRFV